MDKKELDNFVLGDAAMLTKFVIIGLLLITLLSFIFLVSALTSDEKTGLQSELSNLNNFINNDNLMLSIDNKMLT